MTGFAVIGALMTAVAVLCVLVPLISNRRLEADAHPERQTNLGILRDQLAELQADLASGTLPPEQFASAQADLERRVLEEASVVDLAARPSGQKGRWAGPVFAALIPLAVIGLYVLIGEPAGLSKDSVTAEGPVAPAEVEQMVAGLAARLEKNPEDARGWMMLGRSYYVMQRMPEAVAAYAKAVERIKDDPDLYADYADALATSQGRRIEGKALELVKEALRINPAHPKALAMAGTEAFYRKDYAGAIAYWEKLLPMLPPESEMAKSVVGGIAEARQLGGAGPAKSTSGTSGSVRKAEGGKRSPQDAIDYVKGRVTLSPEIASRVKPTDTLFIVARAVNGPRIPLAVLRKTAGDLPADFKLDDSQSMSPELKLSSFPEVTVTARISKSGNAIPQPGDLQGTGGPVKVGSQGIAIVIDTVVP